MLRDALDHVSHLLRETWQALHSLCVHVIAKAPNELVPVAFDDGLMRS